MEVPIDAAFVKLLWLVVPLIVEDRNECTRWLALNDNISVNLQLSTDSSRVVAPRRSNSFIAMLRGNRRHKLS